MLPITHTMQTGITSDSGIVSTEKIWTQFHQMLNCTKSFRIGGGEYTIFLRRKGNQPDDLMRLLPFWCVCDTVAELHHC